MGGGLIAKEKWSRWTDITPGCFCFLLFYPVIAVVALAVGTTAAKWAWVKQPEAGSHSTTTRPLPRVMFCVSLLGFMFFFEVQVFELYLSSTAPHSPSASMTTLAEFCERIFSTAG